VYVSEYIPRGACAVYRVGRWGILNKWSVALFRGSVVSVRLRINSFSHRRAQIRHLFNRYFALLRRILEVDIIEYKSFRGNSYASFYYIVFIRCMVVCIGPYTWLSFKKCSIYPDLRLSLYSSDTPKTLFWDCDQSDQHKLVGVIIIRIWKAWIT
jgi:hypothetical protein